VEVESSIVSRYADTSTELLSTGSMYKKVAVEKVLLNFKFVVPGSLSAVLVK
jgi:hypothetical protein